MAVWPAERSGLYDTDTKVWSKRLWVMGNFSRFVRPGYMRVSTSGTPPSGVLVRAYINPANNALVDRRDQQQHLVDQPAASTSRALRPCTLIPWETSASKNLVPGSGVTVANSRVSLTLARRA